MNSTQITDLLLVIQAVITLFISLRAFSLSAQTRDDMLFSLGLSMGVIASGGIVGLISDVYLNGAFNTFLVQVHWANRQLPVYFLKHATWIGALQTGIEALACVRHGAAHGLAAADPGDTHASQRHRANSAERFPRPGLFHHLLALRVNLLHEGDPLWFPHGLCLFLDHLGHRHLFAEIYHARPSAAGLCRRQRAYCWSHRIARCLFPGVRHHPDP